MNISTGAQCGRPAAWTVGVGSRKTDEQVACGRHLSWVCLTMLEAELPGDGTRTVALTVTPPDSARWRT